MNAVVTKKEIELALVNRFGHVFDRYDRLPAATLPSGIKEIDGALHGFPRGAITEIYGTASSGRTSLILSMLAAATAQEEICTVIDCSDTFNVSSAAKAGIDFNRLLWVRCGHSLERSFKAVDLVLHAGGFGFVVLNLCDVPARVMRRIVSSWWFRFRRSIENTPTALLVLTPIASVRSSAALILKLKNERALWSSTLSIVSENRNDSFTERRKQKEHLSLIATPVTRSYPAIVQTHAHCLRATEIVVNQDRPVIGAPVMKFHTHH